MKRIPVLHLIDSLILAGAESVAVSLVNNLPQERFERHLCATRKGGPLVSRVNPDVALVLLQRKRRFDFYAIWRLWRYIAQHNIRLLHAHSTSLFIAVAVASLPPFPKVIWHVHFGRYAAEMCPARPYQIALRFTDGVIAVNQPLVDWVVNRLGYPADRAHYIPNFVPALPETTNPVSLPGIPGRRIICVANIRPPKDQINLVKAMAIVVQEIPDAHALLAGSLSESDYVHSVKQEIAQYGLQNNVTLLGPRQDVYDILRQCDIGVLSSGSEGLPLALIEYGMAGLATVSTQVGQCADVLVDGQMGMIVPPKAPQVLAQALIKLLQSPELRRRLGQQFRSHVTTVYTPDAVMRRIMKAYEQVLK